MNVLIVCHAGVAMGLGHLTRSLMVAHALSTELDASVHFLIQGDLVERADLAEYDHTFLMIEENLGDAVLQLTQQADAQLVVLDLQPRLVPENIDSLLVDLRREGRKIVAIDGLVNHRPNLDLIFIPSFHFSPPADLHHSSAPILFGWDCFLLNVKYPASEWTPGRQVLALTGGSDATCLGKTLPTLLNESLSSDTELNWVTGPYAQKPIWPTAPRFSMLNHPSPSGLDALMMGANYAMTVYGVSFFELLYYGVPTVVFSPYGTKDETELAAITKMGVALVASDELEAVAKLKELMDDDVTARNLSLQARRKLSVLGGHKFAQSVAALLV